MLARFPEGWQWSLEAPGAGAPMLFNTLEFAVFFAVVLALYHKISHRAQNAMLLVASYFFYACWDWRFVSAIWISTAVDYYVGVMLGRTEEPGKRKSIVFWSVLFNLGFLGFFKYFNFFAGSLHDLLLSLGVNVHVSTLNVVLPVGISFYTFQSMSYTLDIYRREMEPAKHFSDFALSVAFFPHMVAGPIQRARSLIDQVEHPRTTTREDIADGCHLILWGLFKKMVIADTMSLDVDRAFAAASYDGTGVVLAALGFALQIYCDFSGYTDIARGASRLMGFNLMLNFNLPYFARNPQDFWRRWHISLSTWLRDYLYVSLGGNRRGEARTYVNLMLTMVLGGLWHGASWTFVIWGFYHGTLLCVHRAASRYLPKSGGGWIGAVISTGAMFAFTLYGWLIFRCTDAGQLWKMTVALADFRPDGEFIRGVAKMLFYCWPLVLIQFIQFRTGDLLIVRRWPVVAQAVFYLICFYYIVLFGQFDAQSFIYFQF